MHSHTQSIAKLESQIGQLANSMSKREEGRLPSQPMNNPKGQFMLEQQTTSNEHVQAITSLRSGKQFENRVSVNVREDKDQGKVSNPETDETVETPPNSSQPKQNDTVSPSESSSGTKSKANHEVPYVPRAPFPQCLDMPSPFNKNKARMDEVLETFKEVNVTP